MELTNINLKTLSTDSWKQYQDLKSIQNMHTQKLVIKNSDRVISCKTKLHTINPNMLHRSYGPKEIYILNQQFLAQRVTMK